MSTDAGKSLIPKFSSKLPELRRNFDSLPPKERTTLRRSKSFSDLNSIRAKVKPMQKKPLLNSVLKPIPERTTSNISHKTNSTTINKKPRKSKSFTNLTSLSSGSLLKTNTVRNAIAGTKRPLVSTGQKTDTSKRTKQISKNEEKKENQNSMPQKPKVTKPASYDYKARFNLLKEKHITLKTEHIELEGKFGQSTTDLEIVRSENANLTERVDNLEKRLEKLKNAEVELEKYKILHQKSCNENETLNKKINELTQNYAMLERKYTESTELHRITAAELVEKTEALQHVREQLAEYKNRLQEEEDARRHLHNVVQDMKGTIRVFCRIRPQISTENDRQLLNINYIDEISMEIRKSKESIANAANRPTDLKLDFTFDKIFPPEAPQDEVFEDLAQLVQSALDGYHICVFAYGQTGSGKTYTMQGERTGSQLGMIPRSMELLFKTIKRFRKVGWEYSVQVSFLEIYNENIRDLLSIESKLLDIRYNEGRGVTVTNLKIEPIDSVEEFKKLMVIAHKNRAVAATNFNEHSSRSHAVTKIYLKGVNSDSNITYTGSINLVDLAGSESAKTSCSERLVETKNINKSLSALGNVILALHNKENHIPYRNSKLTYLLQSCLGGNSKTLMIVNVSPLEECHGETVNSLRFAAKVKEVKTASRRNRTYMQEMS